MRFTVNGGVGMKAAILGKPVSYVGAAPTSYASESREGDGPAFGGFFGDIRTADRLELIGHINKCGLFAGRSLSSAHPERFILNCIDGYPSAYVDEMIGGAKLMMLIFGIRSGHIALSLGDKRRANEIESVKYDPEMFGIVFLPHSFPVFHPAVLSKTLFPGTAADRVFVASASECISVFRCFSGSGDPAERFVTVYHRNKWFSAGYDGEATVDDLLSFAGTVFGKTFVSAVYSPLPYGEKAVKGEKIRDGITSVCLIDEKEGKRRESDCSNCLLCRRACPEGLMPDLLNGKKTARMFDLSRCMICSACEAVCPSGIHLTDLILSRMKKTSVGESGEKERNQDETESSGVSFDGLDEASEAPDAGACGGRDDEKETADLRREDDV